MNTVIKKLYDNFNNESNGFDRIKRLFVFIDSVFFLLKNDYSIVNLKKETDNNVKLRFLILLNKCISQVHDYCIDLSEITTSIHSDLAEDVSKTTNQLNIVLSELTEIEKIKTNIVQKTGKIKKLTIELKDKNTVLSTCREKEKILAALRRKLARLESKCAEYNIDKLEHAIQEHHELIRKQEFLLEKKKQIDVAITDAKNKNGQISNENESAQKISEELSSINEISLAELFQILSAIKNELECVRKIDIIGSTVKDKMQQILPELDTLVISLKQKLKDQQTKFNEIQEAWHGIYEGNMTFTKQHKNEADEISSDIAKSLGKLDELSSLVINTRDKAMKYIED